MAQSITVSSAFKKNFDEYCLIYGFDQSEKSALRDAIRENFSLAGCHVEQYMKVHHWMMKIWGRIPNIELLVGYLHEKRVFIDVERYGFALLARFCYEESEKSIQISDN